jgi:hypothetical protein
MQDFILYHDTGSGGDFLTLLLQSTGDFYSKCNYGMPDSKGKVTPGPTHPEVQALFPGPIKEGSNIWVRRKWDDWDEAKIKSCTDKIWILNTTSWGSIKRLRKNGCTWPVLRLSYKENMWWFIKKCVMKKMMRPPFWDGLDDPSGFDTYMLEKGKLAPYMLKKHLKYPRKVNLLCKGAREKRWKEHPPKWNIPLDNLLAKDFSPLEDFVPSRFDQKIIDAWVSKQEPMFIKRPMLPREIEKLFGYNKLLEPVDYPCPLDELDNIVINFHYPDAPMFNNTQELFTYF